MHYQGSPFCFVEVSHRSANYDRLNNLTVDMIKKYFNAEDYEVLLMPIGTAMPCIYFNHIFPDNRVIFYSEGSFSSKNYEEMKKYHPETVKVSNEADLIDMLAE
jgi:phosphoserine aminotransferase